MGVCAACVKRESDEKKKVIAKCQTCGKDVIIVSAKADKKKKAAWAVHVGVVTVGSDGVEVKPQMKIGAESDNFSTEIGLSDVRDGIKVAAEGKVMTDVRAEGRSVSELHRNIKCDTIGFKQALEVAKSILSAGKEKATSDLTTIAEVLGLDMASLEKMLGDRKTDDSSEADDGQLVDRWTTGLQADDGSRRWTIVGLKLWDTGYLSTDRKRYKDDSDGTFWVEHLDGSYIMTLDGAVPDVWCPACQGKTTVGKDGDDGNAAMFQLRVEGAVGMGLSAEVRLGWANTQGYKMVGCGGKASAGAGVGADVFAGKHETGTSAMIILGIGNFTFEYIFPLKSKATTVSNGRAPQICTTIKQRKPIKFPAPDDVEMDSSLTPSLSSVTKFSCPNIFILIVFLIIIFKATGLLSHPMFNGPR